MIGIIWIADEPVPITPTRRREKSTPCSGQSPLWYLLPWKLSNPGKGGTRGNERLPVAMMQNGAWKTSPPAVVTVQRSAPRPNTADTTRACVWMKGRSASRSATWLM
jgi:hypothetical protein